MGSGGCFLNGAFKQLFAHPQVKIQLEARVRELAAYPDLLKAAQQSLQDCEDKLQSSERKHSNQSETHRQLQAEVHIDK